MKPFCFAAALFVFTTGCAQTSPPANYQSARPGPADSYFLHTPDRMTPGYSTSKPPRLTVGVSDPDTQLILPWLPTDSLYKPA